MAVLSKFPIVSQLTDTTSDGRPSENKQYDCVAASIGAGILYYQGKTQWDKDINPDRLKDAAYGENWRNQGTAATAYVDFCKSIGFKLYPFNGNPGQLVTEAHKQLAQGHPVIFTEPDPYVSSSLGWSHVCVFYADKPGELTSMDPYIAKSITKSDQEWLNLLLFNQIWIVEQEDEMISIDLNTPGIGNYFEAVPGNANQWRCKQNGKIIQFGILDYYRNNGCIPLCGFSSLGLPVSGEIPLQGGTAKQHFERGVLVYDPSHSIDNPFGAKNVYPAHLYGGVGQDPRVTEQQAQIDQLKQQLAAQPQADPAPLNAIKQVQPLIDQAQTILAPFK
jgi:hypothetical protein